MEEWKIPEDWEEKISDFWIHSEAKTPQEKLNSVIAVLSDNEADDLLDAWDEVKLAPKSCKCACGNYPDFTLLVKNYITGNLIAVGLDCLKKNFYCSAVDQGRILKKEFMYTGTNRMCCSCLKYFISSESPDYVDRCKTCFKVDHEPSPGYKFLKYKACEDCEERDIKPSDTFRKKCIDCYSKYKLSLEPCEDCGVKNIPPSSNTTVCKDCKNKGGMRTCPTCNKNNIPIADAWRKTCGSCWYKSKGK